MGNRVWPWAVAIWLVFAACALWLTRGGLSLDTDSAMRLAGVRDLLHGQGWFDTVQHRMNTPYGLGMHWSRLVDAPLALLMLVSERFAETVWPLGLLLAVLLLLARIAFALGGRTAAMAVLALALLCTGIYAPFTPGDIDHHGLQLALMLAALAAMIEQRPCLAAAAVALGLGVGLEVLPYALGFCAAAAWWLHGDVHKARRFGIALAGVAALLWVATTADPYRVTPICDTYSLFYGALLVAGGAGMAAISLLPRWRMAALAGLAAALLLLAALLNPVCFAGPYAGLDPRMQTLFFARINEALPVWDFFRLAPSQVVGDYLYAVFAIALTWRAPASRGRALVLVAAGIALLVATLQYRAVVFAIVFALPGLAAALARLLERRSIVWLAGAVLLCSGGAFTLAGALLEGEDRVALRVMAFHAQENCGSAQAMTALNGLPPARVAGFVDQGPAILAYTGDAAIAGPYHRDAAGILDSYAIFAGPDPRAVLARRGIGYVMTCRAAPDWNFYAREKGLVAQLAAGRAPSWLAPAGRNGDVEVWKVLKN